MAGQGPGKWVPKASFVMPEVPASLGIDPLVLAVVHADAFLQLSEDEAVDPDAALEASENISAYLTRLPRDRAEAFRRDVAKLAAHARRQKWPADALEFVAEYWENAVGEAE
jgi:hypothetical protein